MQEDSVEIPSSRQLAPINIAKKQITPQKRLLEETRQVIPPISSDKKVKMQSNQASPAAEAYENRLAKLANIAQKLEQQQPHIAFNSPFEFINHITSTNSKDFAYGVPKTQERFNPYDLKLVDYFDIDKSLGYYTISKQVNCI